MLRIFDGHLDLALNAIEFKRDLALPLEELRARQTPEAIERVGTPTVTFEQLRRGGMRVACSTLLARSKPWAPSSPFSATVVPDWPTQDMAYGVARGQLAWYRLMEQRGLLRILITAAQLREHWIDDAPRPGVIITLEGADPIVEPDQLAHWHELGLRTLMLAHFGRSHYAHGSLPDEPNIHDVDGPLTDRGLELLRHMVVLKMPLDLTHLSAASFFHAVEAFEGRVYSSHTACRAIHDLPRNHSDDMLRIIIERGGVIGLPLFNWFLDPDYREPPESRRELVSLDRVIDHVDHICQLAGSAGHAAIGSDLDGGFGREHVPRPLDSIADLHLLAGALADRGFAPADIDAVLGGNWLRFFSETLP